MGPADKAVLRLAFGLGLSVLVAYGMALPMPFMACALTIILLCKPGPPMPFAKGLVAGLVVAGLLIAGILMVPLLQHYRVAGLLITASFLYLIVFAGARKASPLTLILVIAFTLIPIAGVAEQALSTQLAKAVSVGLVTGVFVSGVSHAFFPDPPRAAPIPAPPAAVSVQAASWSALQATLVIMPVFVLALTNPALYLATIMKTVTLGQQAGATTARSAGRELVGSTLMGALLALLVWTGLTLRPNLWMLMLWMMAAALWAGARLFRTRPTSQAPSYWLNVLITMLILLGPGIEDAAVGNDVYRASAIRVSLFIAVALYAWATVWLLERWRARGAALA